MIHKEKKQVPEQETITRWQPDVTEKMSAWLT